MSAVDDALRSAVKAGKPVTIKDLGVSRTTVQKALDSKLLKRIKDTLRTGRQGRPAHLFEPTAKGRRRV